MSFFLHDKLVQLHCTWHVAENMHGRVCIIKRGSSGSPNAIRGGVLCVNLAGFPCCWLCMYQTLEAMVQLLFHNYMQDFHILLKISEKGGSCHSISLILIISEHTVDIREMYCTVNVEWVCWLAENKHNRQINSYVWGKTPQNRFI